MKNKFWIALVTFLSLIIITLCILLLKQHHCTEKAVVAEKPFESERIEEICPDTPIVVKDVKTPMQNISEESDGFVMLSEVIPDIIIELRYYSTYNFVGQRIDGYTEPVALLTKEAATALKQVFELYKLNTQAQVNEESGVMTNLAQDLATEAMQAHIDAIGGSQLYQEMVEANEQVKTFRLAQGTEESQKVLAALEKARKATDEAYDKLCDAIEGGASFADDPAPYEAFITEWNGTIKLYQDMLDRKSGNAGQSQNPGGNGSENPGGNGSETPGEPGNTDDPDNPENPDNPDNPENPENPDNPTNPTNPTEPGSGGGGGSTPDDGDGME